MIGVTSILERRSDVRFRRLDQDGVAILQESARVMGLNDLGIRILECVDGSRTVGEIVRGLTAGAGVSEEVLTKDALAFLEQLVEKGVVQEAVP